MGRRDNAFEMDEHNQPTEPMAQIILSPPPHAAPTHAAPSWAGEPTVPAPPFDARPFPQQETYAPYPQQPYPYPAANAGVPVYPVLPPSPIKGRDKRPPGGAWPIQPESERGYKRRARRPRRSGVPVFVGFFFVLVQLLLLGRVVCMLLGYTSGSIWINLLFTLSSLFILPFRLLLSNVNIPFPLAADLLNFFAVLLAILVYGLLSRILVRFLKALLNSR